MKSAGPSSQVCRPAVRYWRNHGAPHWLLSHQWSGVSLLHGQDIAQVDERKKMGLNHLSM